MESKPKGKFIKKEHYYIFLKKALFLLCSLLLSTTISWGQTKTITGVITDSFNDPLIGVNVRIQGTTTGTVTDIDGNYSLTVSTGDVLEISYVGMRTEYITVGSQSTINVKLEDDSTMLAETVVIGYGTAQKRDLTGSITHINASEIADRPDSNPLASLQGKVAGVQIVNTGRAGQDPEIRIRGTNSINGYTPLYIIDGLFSDNINYINPSDIESMEILKDPSSLAIFGVRGANGVIIVTTKRAKAGQTQVNINSSVGFKKVHDRVSLTNAAQFRELYNEQLANQGADPYDYTNWQADTDWQDQIFQTAFITNNNISITGSSDKNRFYLGVGYTSEEGSIQSEKFKKVTVNFNSDYTVTNFLRFGYQVNGARMLPPDAKGVTAAINAAPIAPVYHSYTNPVNNAIEDVLHIMPGFQSGQVWNPMIAVDIQGNHNLATNHRVSGNIYGEVDFLKNFTFRTTYSLDFAINENRQYSPMISVYNPATNDLNYLNERETVTQNKSTEYVAQQDYILTYRNRFGLHNLTATAGLTTNYREYSNLGGSRSQNREDIYFSIPNDNTDKWWISSLGNTSMTNSGEQWRRFTMSYLLRGIYNYNNRYLVNASYRRDGSSVFRGTGNTWDNFFSFGAGWVMSEEYFMENQEVIDYLKLKGSWGVLGTQNTGSGYYPSYPSLTSSGSAIFGDKIIPGYTYQYLVQDLKWEKTYAWEIGLEMELFNNRLRIEPVYYNKLTKDIIVSLSSRTGAQNSLENLGEIRNRGFELSATWNDRISGTDFGYSVSANLTTINNKVISLGRDAADAIYEGNGVARTLSGQPISHFYGYKVIGVYQNNTDISQSEINTLATVAPGDLKFEDIDGDGYITDKDRTMIGNPTPNYTYGFNINLTYKGFDLGIDMMGVYGNEIYRNWGNSTFAQLNYHTDRLNRWRGEGTSNWEPILDPSRSVNNLASSYYVEDGSFFRIRNLQFGYTFNPELLSRIYVKNLRLYANIQNLKTWHRNSGYVPEVGGSALAFGIDSGSYPMPAVYTFGINLTF